LAAKIKNMFITKSKISPASFKGDWTIRSTGYGMQDKIRGMRLNISLWAREDEGHMSLEMTIDEAKAMIESFTRFINDHKL
jgi:hypothetical protein